MGLVGCEGQLNLEGQELELDRGISGAGSLGYGRSRPSYLLPPQHQLLIPSEAGQHLPAPLAICLTMPASFALPESQLVLSSQFATTCQSLPHTCCLLVYGQ